MGVKIFIMNSENYQYEKALSAMAKLIAGGVLLFIGLVFVIAEYLVFYMDPDREITAMVNGVPQVIILSQLSVWVKVAFALFPMVFILVGLFLLVSFARYKVKN